MKERYLIILIIATFLSASCSIGNPVTQPADQPIHNNNDLGDGSSDVSDLDNPADANEQENQFVPKLDNLTINIFEYKPDIRVDLSYPCVYGNKAAWQSDLKDDMNKRRIILFDIDNLQETDIFEDKYYLDDVCINERFVSWIKTDEEYWELTLYNIEDKSISIVRDYNDILEEGYSSLFWPRLMMSNKYIVWLEGLANRANPEEEIYNVMIYDFDTMEVEKAYEFHQPKNPRDRIRTSGSYASWVDIIDGTTYVCRCNLETKEILKIPAEEPAFWPYAVFRPYANEKYIVYACGNYSLDNALYCYCVKTGDTEKVANNIRAEYCLINDDYIIYNKKSQYYVYSTISGKTLKLTDEEKGSYLFGSVGGNRFIFSNTNPPEGIKHEIVIAEFLKDDK